MTILFGVDVFHIVRPQDKPKILSIQRYPPNKKAIAEFTQLQDKLYSPLFRQQYWQNSIRDRPRIEGFYYLLRDYPAAETIKKCLKKLSNNYCNHPRCHKALDSILLVYS